ncbi:MAG: ABC transporter ATP-binding protein [Candidatus Heimdallarchaeota archaeon]|nr:MAG: ABC transporter ATP-binding protein [Candidatus Heimdallarchaeota archaeon]
MVRAYIEIQNLKKRFGKLYAIQDFNLEIERGEYVVILGPTGAGKTTLLKLIAGLVKPTSGNIYKNGELLNNIPPEKRNFAYLPQTSDYSLFPYMDVWENTVFSPKMKGDKPWEEVIALGDEILDLVNLRTRYNAYPDELSGGMMQRVALARAIAADADVFLLDEPLRALDARLRIRLRTEIRKLVTDLEKTTFHVTHDQEEAIAVADRVLIINEGKIVQFDIPEEIYNYPSTLFAAYFFGTTNLIPATKVRNETNGKVVRAGEHNITIKPKDIIRSIDKEEKYLTEELVLAIKAEKILVTPLRANINPDPKVNVFEGTVEQAFFLGKWANLAIKVEGLSKKELHVIIPSSDLHQYDVGTNVRLEIPIDNISYFIEPWEEVKKLEMT